MTFGPSPDPKVARLYVRFTPDEKAALSESAARSGLGMSEYVRRRALGLPVLSHVDDKAINELRRLGGLVKHAINKDGTHRSDYLSLLGAIRAAVFRLSRSAE